MSHEFSSPIIHETHSKPRTTMTAKQKRYVNITVSTAAIGGALIAAIGWGMPSASVIVSKVDQHWVRADTFALKSQRDSLNRISEQRELRHVLDSTAKDLKTCIRHPEDCR